MSFPRGKSFLKQMLFHGLYEVTIGFGWTVFSETDVGGTKISKERGRGGSSMDDVTS